MRRLRWIAFVLFLAALFGYEAYALFVQESGTSTSSNIPPARDLHLTTELRGPDAFLRQWFAVHADGFTAIEVYPHQSEHPPSGPMRVVVYEPGGPAWTPVATEFLDAAALDLTKPLRIAIPRMDHSSGREFVLEIYLPVAPPGHGLRFEAGGPTYAYGYMVLAGQPQWGDLKFRTELQRTTLFANVQRLRHTLPAPFRTDAFFVVALVLGNWALATVVYGLAFAPDASQLPNGSDGITADQPRV
jgi:hypothetical protein